MSDENENDEVSVEVETETAAPAASAQVVSDDQDDELGDYSSKVKARINQIL